MFPDNIKAPSNGSVDSNPGAIIGGVIAAVVIIAAVGGAVIVYIKKRRKGKYTDIVSFPVTYLLKQVYSIAEVPEDEYNWLHDKEERSAQDRRASDYNHLLFT